MFLPNFLLKRLQLVFALSEFTIRSFFTGYSVEVIYRPLGICIQIPELLLRLSINNSCISQFLNFFAVHQWIQSFSKLIMGTQTVSGIIILTGENNMIVISGCKNRKTE